jgi:ribonuclease HII
MSLWEYEGRCWAEGHETVCGVDEAGAGPLAGPVYAGAVILPRGLELKWLNDSKQVTAKRRETLFEEIKAQAVAWAVAFVDAEEIDRTDILSARMKAMQMAIDALAVKPDFALIDGNRDKGKSAAIATPHQCIVKGDSLSASIAAASILAKVSRDHFMVEMGKKYPEYGFEKHKGYGTKLHYERLDRYGPSPIHRKTFLTKWEARS